jgi:hypothetical protein
MNLSNFLKGNALRIRSCREFDTSLASIVHFVTEAEPILRVVQLIPGRSLKLLHIVEDVFPKDDAFNDVGLEGEFSVRIRHSGGN